MKTNHQPNRQILLATLLAIPLVLMTCSKDNEDNNDSSKVDCGEGSGYPVLFCRQIDHYESGFGVPGKDYIEVACLVGPKGATVSNCTNGTYYCSGTYKLTTYDHGKIDIGWGGTVSFTDPTYDCYIDQGEGTFELAINKTSGGSGNIFLSMSSGSDYMFSTVLINLDCNTIDAPSNLLALYNAGLQKVTLAWKDNSNNETAFEVYRSLSHTSDFTLLSALGKNVTDFTDETIEAGKSYYYYITARNDRASSHSNTASVNTFVITVTDIDGNTYQTMSVEGDIWMAENLRTTRYADGTPLVDGSQVLKINDGDTTQYWFVYNNDTASKEIYGLLYTWTAAMRGAASSDSWPGDVQGVCPDGWHLPGKTEWKMLINYAGGEEIAGGKLKSTGTVEGGTGLWNSPNTGATDAFGFHGLPGGLRTRSNPWFSQLGNVGFFWSSTEYSQENAYRMTLDNDSEAAAVRGDYINKILGHSVRCVKNQ